VPGSACIVGHLCLPLLTGGDAPVVGGAEVQTVHLAEELHRRGWRLAFLVCALDDATPPVVETRLGPALVLYRRRLAKSLAVKLREKRATWRAVRRTPADLVFQRAVWDADVAAMAARSRGVPYVYALASDRDAIGLPRVSRRRFVLGAATAIAAQSEAQRAAVAQYGRRSAIVPSGFPVPAWDPEAPRDTVLWAGTLRALKRPDAFLDLAARFPAQRFVLAGGPGEDAALAERVAARAAGLPNVEARGFVPYAGMAALFARARVLVNTSTYEGFPNTFVLAWLHGAVVLSLGVDPDGCLSRRGFGVVARDPENLALQLGTLLAAPAACAARVARARAHAAAVHDIRRVADAYEALFTAARA